MLEFDIQRLKGSELRLEFAEPVADFPRLQDDAEDGHFAGEVCGVATLSPVGDAYLVRGRVSGVAELECGRCLESYRIDVATDFEVSYVRSLHIRESDDEEGVELSGDEMTLMQLEGSTIDLIPIIEEHLLLALPMGRLCREECGGICQFCGAPKGDGTCTCEAPVFNNKFAALKKISFDK